MFVDKSVVLLNLFLDKSVEASAQVTKKQAFSWKFGELFVFLPSEGPLGDFE